MKKVLLASFLVAFVLPAFGQRSIDVLHYKYEIELNDNNDTIYGKALIKFIAKSKTSSATFDLANINKERKGIIVTTAYFVSRVTDEISFPNFIHNNEKLTTLSEDIYKDGDTCYTYIIYKGIPADGLIISKNKYGNRTFFSDNWPNRAHNWIPCVDDPGDKATVEFIVTAPSHYQVISNGIQIEETNLAGNKKLTHWREDVPLPTKVMVIGVADFAVNTIGDVNCVPVSSWVYPENKAAGFYDYASAKEILSWYINYIGAYAYKKLANVQSKTPFGGMENASAIFYFENSVTGNRNEEALIAHEIVHQWFGNMATEKSFAHLWLSEGFATYLTHVYIESKYGTDSLNKRMGKEREEVIAFVQSTKRPVVDSTKDYMSLLNENSYLKGGWVLHMLRRQLGDSVFHKAVRQYYAAYAGKNADTKDLQTIFETVSEKKLTTFFDQWLHTPENLKLKITWKYLEKEKKAAITVEQLQNKIFESPLDISVTTGLRKNDNEKLFLSKRKETFYLATKAPILKIEADHNTSLLFEGSVAEIK